MSHIMVDTDVVTAAVRLACRAPSVHNSQPWRWVAGSAGLNLFADPKRWVHATDRSGREALISCGAVLDHLRVAMQAAGWTINVERFPNPNNLDHVAAIDFTPLSFVTDAHRARAGAIAQRRTDRLPFAAPTDWELFEPMVRSTFSDNDAHLDVVADEVRHTLAEASRLSESLRLYDSSYHAELDWWTAPFHTTEGIPCNSLVSAAESERVDVARSFPVGSDTQRRPDITADRSTILVLSTDDDTGGDAVRCGEVLSTVLLECTMAGLATCTLTNVTESQAGRDAIASLIGRKSFPQLLIRVGLAPTAEPEQPLTPRRPLSDVFVAAR
ncbi:Acg family FMN-binding oxidoreductase [Mycolicibacterium komossense]|uniref:NAD(P)H nitroreductase n=1 Tax=Mycolicibacterium komossense TaxID=1779 RepID=A0ABT3CJ82_9MYCO|nr:NAD(P)H nitroreductase [Mycolicibacterium komossense]MCV7229558.1 NAD(P)H nitroreductase [Mycolicibacterium komossense]